MRKIFIKKEVICPFNYCRTFIFTTEEDKSMDIRCENCEYVWNRNSTLMIKEGNLFLDKDSKEYKEYEMLHTTVCIDDLKSNIYNKNLHSERDRIISEALKLNLNNKDIIGTFNKHIAKEIKERSIKNNVKGDIL